MQINYNQKNELELPIKRQLEENIQAIESIFSEWGDLVKKKFVLQRADGNLDIFIFYIDGLTDNEMVERTITRPLLYEWRGSEQKKGDAKAMI